METRYALIKNGKVDNVIIADADFIAQITDQYDHIELLDTPEEQTVSGPGWTWDGKSFTQPIIDTGLATPEQRKISVGAFFDRFGDQKYPILASANPMVKAIIQDASVRTFIDLENPQLPMGLSLIQSAGFTIDATKIITDPIQPTELP